MLLLAGIAARRRRVLEAARGQPFVRLHRVVPLRLGRGVRRGHGDHRVPRGLPDLPGGAARSRSRRPWRRAPARSRSRCCSLRSVARCCPGSSCSRRPLILIPWYGLCSVLASDGRSRDEARDRVVVVGTWADAATLARRARARRAARDGHRRVVARGGARRSAEARRHSIESVRAGDATVVVLDRDAQLSQSIIDQVAQPSRERRARAHAVAVLRRVAGQAARVRARAGVADVRHRRIAPGALQPREARDRRRRSRRSGTGAC